MEKMKEVQLSSNEVKLISMLDLTGGIEWLPLNDGSHIECEALAVALAGFLYGARLACERMKEAPDGDLVIMDEQMQVIAQTTKTDIENRKNNINSLFRKLYPVTYSKLYSSY